MRLRQTKKRGMKGGTGVFIDDQNLRSNFIDFLNHSTVEFLGNGAYGFVYKATLRPNSKSPYKMLDYQSYGAPVDTLIIKLGVLGYKDRSRVPSGYPRPITPESFRREVNIQTDVFLKTMKYLQPLCPGIVYSDIHRPVDPLIDHIINKITDSKEENILEFIKDNVTGYTLIGMEMMKDYEMLHAVRQRIKSTGNESILPRDLYKPMLAYILIELALETGYSHADFHPGNIMVNLNDPTYFKGKPASIVLIDFGLAVKIPVDKMKVIKSYYAEQKYQEIIDVLCIVPRSDGEILKQHIEAYGYMCGISLPPDLITELFQRREESIKDIVEASSKNRAIPLLPLSNSAKNTMFPGMDEPFEPIASIATRKIPSSDGFNPFENIPYDKVNMISNMNIWLCDVIQYYFRKNTKKPDIVEWKYPNWYCHLIDTSYYSIYLILYGLKLDIDSIFWMPNHHQLAMVVAMFCCGINHGNKYVKQILTEKGIDIYEELNMICDEGRMYTHDTMEKMCLKYFNLLKKHNVKLHTIKNYITPPVDFEDFRNKFTDPNNLILMYTDPVEWMKLNYNYSVKKPVVKNMLENVEFPFGDVEDLSTIGLTEKKGKEKKVEDKELFTVESEPAAESEPEPSSSDFSTESLSVKSEPPSGSRSLGSRSLGSRSLRSRSLGSRKEHSRMTKSVGRKKRSNKTVRR